MHVQRWAAKVKVSPLSSTALNRTIQNLAARGQTIDDYNYENKEIGEIILEEIGDTKFDGISVSACKLRKNSFINVIATYSPFRELCRLHTNLISEPKAPDPLARRRVQSPTASSDILYRTYSAVFMLMKGRFNQ